jgi:hypothetical protein
MNFDTPRTNRVMRRAKTIGILVGDLERLSKKLERELRALKEFYRNVPRWTR